MSERLSRRDFLKLSGRALAALAIPKPEKIDGIEQRCYEVEKFGLVGIGIDRQTIQQIVAYSLLVNYGEIPGKYIPITESTKYLFNFTELYDLYSENRGVQSIEEAKREYNKRNYGGGFGIFGETPFIFIDLERSSAYSDTFEEYAEILHIINRSELGHLTDYIINPEKYLKVLEKENMYHRRPEMLAANVADGVLEALPTSWLTWLITKKITRSPKSAAAAGLFAEALSGFLYYEVAENKKAGVITSTVDAITDVSFHTLVDEDMAKSTLIITQSCY